jgi:hypothetical protein
MTTEAPLRAAFILEEEGGKAEAAEVMVRVEDRTVEEMSLTAPGDKVPGGSDKDEEIRVNQTLGGSEYGIHKTQPVTEKEMPPIKYFASLDRQLFEASTLSCV